VVGIIDYHNSWAGILSKDRVLAPVMRVFACLLQTTTEDVTFDCLIL
jgi:hypothetical protein